MENDRQWLVNMSSGVFQTQYILGEIIGRGSTSTIHSCLYKGKKRYACRIVQKALIKEEILIRIQTRLLLHHENIVSVREAFDDPLQVYIIEDLAFGGELLERFAACGGYSEKDAAKAVRHIARALQYLHKQGICHGNLRPEKLLYATEDDNSRLVLTDIGVVTQASMSPYKILYYAPEVIATGKSILPSDLWSLGIVLYIMLCGFEPFRNAEKIFPSPYWDDKSEEAKALTAWLMNQRPEDRPTAEELLENPWVQGKKTPDHTMTDTVQNLREFNARKKFKAATLAVRATHRAFVLAHCRPEVFS